MNAKRNFYLDAVKGRPSAEVFNAMLCVYSLLQRRMDEYFKPHALTPVKFNVLLLLKHYKEGVGLSQNELCHHMIVSPSNITRLIDRLIKDGYAKRTVLESDRRVKLIKITPKGSGILDKLFHGYGEMVQQSAYVLDRQEVEALAALLLKWFSKLEDFKQEEGDER